MAIDRVTITPDDRGPVINIISWILIVLTSLATLIKMWSKWSLTKKLGPDDWYLAGSTLAAAGWVAATAVQVKTGLGRHISTMSAEDLVSFQKSAYASEFLYVLSLCLAKMAILDFMLTLARANNRRIAVYGTMIFNAISMGIGIFAVAFQCPFPATWATLSDNCFDQSTFWIAFGVMDIIVDFATVVLPYFLLHDLRTTWKRKLPAIAAFGLRFLIIPLIIVRLVFVRSYAASADSPFDDFDMTIATSFHVNFSVIFTCLPFLKTVMDNIQTGLLGGEIHVSNATRYGYGYGHEHKLGQSDDAGQTTLQQSGVTSSRRKSSKTQTPYQKSWNLSYDYGASLRNWKASDDRAYHQPMKDWKYGAPRDASDRRRSYDLGGQLERRETLWDHQQPYAGGDTSFDHAFSQADSSPGYGRPQTTGNPHASDDRMVINQTTTFSVRDDRAYI